MDLPDLLSATIINRYKRFLIDLKLPSGDVVTAHCPNSGSMLGVLENSNKAYISKTQSKLSKLGYKLELL